jgi:hypothetical protein
MSKVTVVSEFPLGDQDRKAGAAVNACCEFLAEKFPDCAMLVFIHRSGEDKKVALQTNMSAEDLTQALAELSEHIEKNKERFNATHN